MKNCLVLNGQNIELTEDQIKQLMEAFAIFNSEDQEKMLSEFSAGDVIKIGDFELVVLEQLEGQTALILKEMYGDEIAFAEENNDYRTSYVDERCQKFALELASQIGEDNIILHEVDLTSDDGLKDYGVIERKASLITADMYRKYVEILDKFNPDCWWWLATAHSTKRHENDKWAKCVAPSGFVYGSIYYFDYGVRPFCILKSTIFVSE